MQTSHSYDTVTEAIRDLKSRGYTEDLNIPENDDCIICGNSNHILSPDEFEIDETYRFEGDTDPGDEMIVFAISSEKHGIRGILVNAFGTYADSHATEIVARLKQHVHS